MHNTQVAIIGAGHAGIEAAYTCSKLGVSTMLVMQDKKTIGKLSCNPSIGGIGKSQIVKEIYALQGFMPYAADACSIHWNILNSSKGPAVRSTRAQIDKESYERYANNFVSKLANLTLIEAEALNVDKKNGLWQVSTENEKILCKCLIIATGTFLAGKIHIGDTKYEGGRYNEKASKQLANSLEYLLGPCMKLKTGTPPRLLKSSIDFSKLTEQKSIQKKASFTCENLQFLEKICCHITRTNKTTHEIIGENLNKSAMFSGDINVKGPRYCPSIEDKIHRWPDKNQHQIFLEPEGLTAQEYYPNGLSTSFPKNIQEKIIHSIDGLEKAEITKYGYAVEYGCYDPINLKMTLETKAQDGLYLAGQINGTTGYEEAACQGLIAGLNAALRIKNKDAWYPKRHEAYIGVLLSDLTTKGIGSEPYRMFTSRAEHRLILREDNACERLTEIGHKLLSIVDIKYYQNYMKRMSDSERIKNILNNKVNDYPNLMQNIKNTFFSSEEFLVKKNTKIIDILKKTEINYEYIAELISELKTDINLNEDLIASIEIEAKYAGYIKKQMKEVEKLSYAHDKKIPSNLNYHDVYGLSNEVLEKLSTVRPETIGQASKIPGITPCAISILLVHLKKINKFIGS